MDKIEKLLSFIEESIEYFQTKIKDVNKDQYFADRDIRNILDKTINDIILCIVDLAEECLKKYKKGIPDTYKDTILACHEFLGDISLTIAPLTRRRNEMIHQYLKINWQNIIAVRDKIPEIKKFSEQVKKIVINKSSDEND